MTIIPKQYTEELTKLLWGNGDLFAKADMDLGRTEALKMKIDTGDHLPMRMPPYRTPMNQRSVVEKATEDTLKAKITRPSTSIWSFPIVLAPKKDGSKRFCVDFRTLNRMTRKHVFSLPLIDDVFSELRNSNFFRSLDLGSGYSQVPVEDKDRRKTVVVCHKNIFEFYFMAMGLTNSGSFFQELMTHVLGNLCDYARTV